MGNNNEFQKTPCTDECYVRISDLIDRQAALLYAIFSEEKDDGEL